jgi:hypothetical protein
MNFRIDEELGKLHIHLALANRTIRDKPEHE